MKHANAGAKAAACAAVAALALAIHLHAQEQAAPAARLEFEVASVKPAAPGETGGIVRPDPGYQTYICTNADVITDMTVAYQVAGRQISGGPSWLGSDRWDIIAKADKPHSIDELHLMLQHLLEDRFQLKLHRESRQESGYDLVVDKDGPKMPVHDPPNDTNSPPIGMGPGGPGMAQLSGPNVAMNYFALFLSRILGAGVEDKTGLTDHYDIALKFPLPPPPTPPEGGRGDGPPPAAPDFANLILIPMQQQLGLRLERAKVPVDYIVIDHAEKPTGN